VRSLSVKASGAGRHDDWREALIHRGCDLPEALAYVRIDGLTVNCVRRAPDRDDHIGGS